MIHKMPSYKLDVRYLNGGWFSTLLGLYLQYCHIFTKIGECFCDPHLKLVDYTPFFILF